MFSITYPRSKSVKPRLGPSKLQLHLKKVEHLANLLGWLDLKDVEVSRKKSNKIPPALFDTDSDLKLWQGAFIGWKTAFLCSIFLPLTNAFKSKSQVMPTKNFEKRKSWYHRQGSFSGNATFGKSGNSCISWPNWWNIGRLHVGVNSGWIQWNSTYKVPSGIIKALITWARVPVACHMVRALRMRLQMTWSSFGQAFLRQVF